MVPMRGVIKRSTIIELALTPPPRDASKYALPSYHIKGLCNAIYVRAEDHQLYPPGGDSALVTWSKKVILGEEVKAYFDASRGGGGGAPA